MHDQIMFNQQRWVRERSPDREFRDYARALGVDIRRYDACVSDRSKLGQLEASKQEGLDLGITATPSYVINGTLYVGAMGYDSLVTLIERAEAAAQQ
jgi:protein-disulfide isomerase